MEYNGINEFLPFFLNFDEPKVSYDQIFAERGLFTYIYLTEGILFGAKSTRLTFEPEKGKLRIRDEKAGIFVDDTHGNILRISK